MQVPMEYNDQINQYSKSDWKFWKNLFLFAACPVIALAHVSAFVLPEASDLEPPPFVQYDHLRIRTKVTVTTNKYLLK